ncbi:DUF7927 domain-containing protein [Lentzea aerocolonigenes]|uniref:DUF7927 domain-containing protein n=1 Tax=Lentzea aerocolonigenes TaxID=68170 RepID=UPI0004C2CEBB|nr:DUF11 domain-containing protein [Lentzea aerocolonigenes]MCP2243601.1 conserved repeat domain-containing protein [Lentzea aerocolonigenes]
MSRWTRLAGVCAVALLLGTALSPSLALSAQQSEKPIGPAGTRLRSPQTFFAYLKPDEKLDVSFVKDDDLAGSLAEDLVVAVRRPSGADVSCTISDSDPEGTACTWSGLTAPVAGIWAVEVTVSACPSTGICGRDSYGWDVTVRNGVTGLPGRVWSERFAMNQDPSSPPVDLSFWYQSEFGYTYRATYRGYHGIDSTFEADSFGIVQDGTCTSAYQSSATPRPARGACGGVFKLFFESPSPDLPPAATRWNGTTDWIRQPEPAPAVITGGTFTPSAPGTRAGTLAFDLSGYSGPLTVHVDVNDDGDHTDPTDRTLPVTAAAGAVVVPFDGLDGAGARIPAGQSFSFEVVVDRVAEIHFVNTDAELRGGGIDVHRLNGPAFGRTTLQWNDTAFPNPDRERCGAAPITDGRTGIGSAGGVHGWGLGTCGSVAGANANDGVHGGWGDLRAIEEWTYVPILVTHTVRVPGRDIRIAKTASRSAAQQDDVVTYTITAEHVGDHVHTLTGPVKLTDDLSGVLDDAKMEGVPVASSGTVSFVSPVVSWSGPLAPGETAVITYSVRVNRSDLGDRRLVGAVRSDTPGADCAAASANPACTTVVHVPSLKIVTTADRAEFEPGGTVLYTVTVTNDGQVPFTASDPASFANDLTGVLDDAKLAADEVTASAGAVDYDSPVLTWTGPLDVGQTASVTYPVAVTRPDTGDGALRSTATGPPGVALTCAACEVELLSSTVSVNKKVLARTLNPDGSFTLVYDVVVTGGGSAPSTYDLSDTLRFGAGVAVNATSALDLSGTTVPVGWDGVGETSVVTGVNIAPGASHTYRLTAVATPSAIVTSAAADCSLDWGEPGTGFHSTATVTSTGGTSSATTCEPIPLPAFGKVALPEPPAPVGDALSHRAGLSMVSASARSVVTDSGWGEGAAAVFASDVDSRRDTYSATAGATVEPEAGVAAMDCTMTEGENATDFSGIATLTANGPSRQVDGCAEQQNLVVGMQAAGTPVPGEDGTFTQAYDITVGNRGEGEAVYDLAGRLWFGKGVAVESAAVVNTTPGSLPVKPWWDGGADTALVSAVAIGGGVTHVYRIAVVITPDPDVTTGAAANCGLDSGETGTGFRAIATLSHDGRAQQAVACTAPPAISVAKGVTATVPNSDGTYTITYEIVVTNDGWSAGHYDLADSLEYGAGVEVVGAEVVTPPAAGPGTGWDGTNDALLAENVTIEGNASHAYTVTVVVAPPDDPAPGALDCSLDSGESGTGARNTARVTSNGVVKGATACAALAHLSITEAVLPGSPRANGDATFTVTYQIDVRNSGAEPTTYDLTEELLPGKGISVVSAVTPASPGWNGTDEQKIANGVAIGAGERDTYLLTVVYVVNVVYATSTTTDCLIDDGEAGSGFGGRAIATGLGLPRTAFACAEAPVLSINHTMTGLTSREDGSHTAVYEIAVTNLGAGAGHYDLTDDLRFGSGVEVEKVAVSAIGDAPAPDSGWHGAGGLVSDARIDGGDTQVYRVTVVVTSEATGKAADCVVDPEETTTGLRNVATIFTNGVTEQAVACGSLAGVSVAQDVVRTTPLGDGYQEISYRITVANDGVASATYSLHDTLRYGVGTAVRSAVIDGAPDWNGALQPVVRTDVPVAAGERHVYAVKVVVAPPANARAESFDCVLDPDEEGTGALNTAAVVVDGVTKSADACAAFPGVTITKELLPGSPKAGSDGEVVVDYRITVVNGGAADITYDLDDRLHLRNETEVTSLVVRMSPDVAPTNPGWNGRSDSWIARGVHLAPGLGHSYVVTARVVPDVTDGDAPNCAPDAGEDDRGLRDEATVTVNGTALTTEACAPLPVDELARTGVDIRSLCGVGFALLLAGVFLVLAAHRHRTE